MADGDIDIALSIDFPGDENYPSYSDILYIPQQEYNTLTENDLMVKRQARYEIFKTTYDNPQPEPTKSDKQDNLLQLIQNIRELVAQGVLDGIVKPRMLTRLDTLLLGFNTDRN